jgi:hypothetical protein
VIAPVALLSVHERLGSFGSSGSTRVPHTEHFGSAGADDVGRTDFPTCLTRVARLNFDTAPGTSRSSSNRRYMERSFAGT